MDQDNLTRIVPPNRQDTDLAKYLRQYYIGQDDAVDALVDIYSKFQSGLNDPTKPLASVLMLGPTGVGKTHLVNLFCQYLYGPGEVPMTIDCGEYQHDHQMARLLGSPPGYLGHNETAPFFSPASIARKDRLGRPIQVVLFDEIEKASQGILNLMLGILDRATMSTGKNEVVDFKHTIIFITSNLGSKRMIKQKSLGFNKSEAYTDEKIRVIAQQEAKVWFSPEQYNRLDSVICFKTLDMSQIEAIRDIELRLLNLRLLRLPRSIQIDLDDEVKQYLLTEGYDEAYGARHLKRTIDLQIVKPLARVMGSSANINQKIYLKMIEGQPAMFQQMALAATVTNQSADELEMGAEIELEIERGNMLAEKKVTEIRRSQYYISQHAMKAINQFRDPKDFRCWTWKSSENPRYANVGFTNQKYPWYAFEGLLNRTWCDGDKQHWKLCDDVIAQLTQHQT